MRANEGVGPNGEVQYLYRHYYGAAFSQDDFKVTTRLALNAGCAGSMWAPLFDKAGAIGNVWPSLLQQVPVRRPRELWSGMWLRRITIRR